jgi:hypothetical protein
MYCPICQQSFKVAHRCHGFVYPPQDAIPKPPYHMQDEEITKLRSALAEKEKECEGLKKVVVMILGCGSYAEHDYTCFEIAQAARQALEGGEK